MTTRREVMVAAGLGGATLLAAARREAFGAGDGATDPAAARALLDRYVAAVNAHDTSVFAEIFTQSYIQHSGRSPSGLAAQVENFRRIIASMPDVRMTVDDRIVEGDKIVARTTYSATHTQPLRGIAPTSKAFTFRTIDIWRIENGKFAEHWDLTDAAEVIGKLRD